MNSERTRTRSTNGARRFALVGAVGVLVTVALLAGSGVGSSAAATQRGQAAVPVALAKAIHARLGAGAIRSSSAAAASVLPGPLLGLSVALSSDGTTALVGAPGVAAGKGAAYIFHASEAGSWSSTGTPVATLTNKHGTATALFGLSVALSADGTTAFVGAPFNGNFFAPAGAVYVFHASAEDAWHSASTPAATLKATGGVIVGFSVAVSSDGTTLLAGSPVSHGGAGGAYVFHVSSEGAWASTSTPNAALSKTGASSNEAAGQAVAISGDGTTALVDDSGNSSGGGAYLYHVVDASDWASSSTPTAILSDSNSVKGDTLGIALALSADGTLAALGAPGTNDEAGSVDVFHSLSAAAWTTTSIPTATLTKAGGASGDVFGETVAVAPDGATVFTSAPGVNGKRGAGYIFHALSEAAWLSSSTPTATLTDSTAKARDGLGIGVFSNDGATALIGVPGVNKTTGVAEVFHVESEGSWANSSTPKAILTNKALAACVVPKLKGLKLRAAKNALAIGRCHLGRVTKVYAKPAKRGRVLSQSKRAGKRLAIGAKINVKIGK